MDPHDDRERQAASGNLRPFSPGQSGNPGGRPRRKPITDLIRAELEKAARGSAGQTKGEQLAARLVGIALQGNRTDSLAATKLIMAYTDGMPTQPIELDFYDAARREAQARGLDPDKVISLYERMKQQGRGR